MGWVCPVGGGDGFLGGGGMSRGFLGGGGMSREGVSMSGGGLVSQRGGGEYVKGVGTHQSTYGRQAGSTHPTGMLSC